MANEYVTVDELKATLQVTGTGLDADLARALEAASRAIEKACSRRGLRRFWPDAAASTRLYTAGDRSLLEIHDAYAITSVETDDDGDGTYERLWGASDWVACPLNAATDGEPWTAIQARISGTNRGFPVGLVGGVRVTAKSGWAAVPAVVPSAVGLLAGRLVKRAREAPFAIVGFGMDAANAVHIARTDPDVAGLIHDLVRDTSARSVRLG
jgi:hypothetical protein